jgi:hypothetical protein
MRFIYGTKAPVMRINLIKKVFTSQETEIIRNKLRKASKHGILTRRSENNRYLLVSYKGVEEKGISPKWNVKIYAYNLKKRGHSLVCVDKHVLGILLKEDYDRLIPPDRQLLRIDDAGWGFPLCGVMVGVSVENELRTAVVPVEYFRNDTANHFGTKRYLKRYAELGIQIIDRFGATPGTHRIEICTGYVNQSLREKLRRMGYDVRVVEIKGILQNRLEAQFKAYVREAVGSDIYYDPKKMKVSDIPKRYGECLAYGKRYCPHLLKTGWNSISG